MSFKYLSKDILDGFDKYKYNAKDTSPVSKYITHPFWNWFVEFVPKWIAPNVLTFAGLLCLLLEVGFVSYYDRIYYASDDTHPEYPPVPRWVWFMCAQCMFWAHTLDGIDGKQARRTGSSGPLGELFDHGIDSLATLLMPTAIYSVYGRGPTSLPPDRVYYGVFLAVFITFISSHWEKYNTGVLYLPWGYDISQIGMTIVYLVTWCLGHEFWHFEFDSMDMTAGEFVEMLMYLGVYGISVPMTLWNIFVCWKSGNLKQSGIWESMRPVIPVIVEFTLFILWSRYSSISILLQHPRLFHTATGFVFSNIACRLIVSSMSSTRCQLFNWLLVPLVAITAAVYYLNLGIIELYLLSAYTILAVAAHLHYAICVVQELANHLGIYVFTVGKKNVD